MGDTPAFDSYYGAMDGYDCSEEISMNLDYPMLGKHGEFGLSRG